MFTGWNDDGKIICSIEKIEKGSYLLREERTALT